MIGDRWDTTIQRASFRIRFPRAEGGKGLRAKIFGGEYGSTQSQILEKLVTEAYGSATDTTVTLQEDQLTGVRNSALPPYHALTVVLALPENLIQKPGPFEVFMNLLLANFGFGIPFLVLFGMSLFWVRYGRDPSSGPMVVQFDPPDGISGPEAGTLLDEQVDMRDLAAGIISLAVAGYVKIEPKETGLVFKRRSADIHIVRDTPGQELNTFESFLLRKLAACGKVVSETELRTSVAPHVEEMRTKLYDALVSRGYYVSSPHKVRMAWTVGGIVVVGLLAFISMMISPFENPVPAIIGGGLGALLVILFARGMPRRTESGAKALALVRGFEEFIRRAKGDELEWMSKKHPDAALFEKYLPHAIAFGLTQQWAGAFEGIVKEMPSWYMAPHGMHFHPMYFSNDLVTISNSLGSAATTPPRSSGASGGHSGFSSGGGFSGGGFGGGGGGSW
ncbi:MAG TPA: DUF2207 domain-containing protein, partial [Fimbriimonadaceae bacterium]|nr:DUF2207 domain-containing protein [Fimbriimonadaceae bacterium]